MTTDCSLALEVLWIVGLAFEKQARKGRRQHYKALAGMKLSKNPLSKARQSVDRWEDFESILFISYASLGQSLVFIIVFIVVIIIIIIIFEVVLSPSSLSSISMSRI
jgi:hypothetical protein